MDARDNKPLPTTNPFDQRAFMRDEEAFNLLLDEVASGKSIRQVCSDLDLPASANTKLNRSLAALKAPDPRYEMYQEAKRARACQFADRLLDVCTQVETGLMTSQQGSMVTKSLMWLAERLDPGQWSGRIQVDANMRLDVTTQHLEAVRMLSTMVKDGRPGIVHEGDVVEVQETVDEYELLN